MRSMTIVIPTYNEAGNLPSLSDKLWALPLTDLKLLIVDDNSPDGTGALAEKIALKYPGKLSVIHRSGKQGLGSAYIAGFRKALMDGAEAVGQMDADFSHSPKYVPDLLEQMEKWDVAVGSRYIPGGSLDDRWSMARVLLSRFGNAYARSILRLPIRDVTGGFRIWRRETLLGMPLEQIRSNGFVFQVEMAFVAQRLGYRIIERPICFEDRRVGQSKMSFRIQLEAALRVWQVFFLHHNLTPADRHQVA